MKKRLKEIALFMIPIFLIFVVFGGFFLLWKSASEGKTRNVELQEIENGKYVFIQSTFSSIPFQNYKIATIRTGNSVIQIRGNVQMIFTDSEKPKAVITETNLANGDSITCYVSSEQVEYKESITIR